MAKAKTPKVPATKRTAKKIADAPLPPGGVSAGISSAEIAAPAEEKRAGKGVSIKRDR